MGQHFNDLGVTADAHVDRMDRMWCLQSAHPRLVRRMRVLEVINRVVGSHRRRRGNELVSHLAQLRDILSREDVGNDDEAIAIIGGALCTCERSVSPSRLLPHAKEHGIEAIKVQDYRGLRRAHNEQIFNRYKTVLDTMGDQAAYIGPVGAGTIAKLVHNRTSAVMGCAARGLHDEDQGQGRAARGRSQARAGDPRRRQAEEGPQYLLKPRSRCQTDRAYSEPAREPRRATSRSAGADGRGRRRRACPAI